MVYFKQAKRILETGLKAIRLNTDGPIFRSQILAVTMNTQKIHDYIIIGQGLAGSLLAHELLEYTQNILVIDDHLKSSASNMAAGLINPVTGMRIVKTADVEALLPAARSRYRSLEIKLKIRLLHETPMLRILQSADEYSKLLKRQQQPEYQPWVGDYHIANAQTKLVDQFGSFDQRQTGWLDVSKLLLKTRELLSHHYQEYSVHPSNIRVTRQNDQSLISVQNDNSPTEFLAKHLIFCRGYKDQDNSWFDWLPFTPVKGEILTLRANKALPSSLINFSQWVIPIDSHTIKTGASWDRENLDLEITSDARDKLMQNIRKLYKIPGLEFKVLEQQAGIRPCTRQRTPFVGQHPQTPQISIFNGFGSKGSLLIPYYAKQFARQLSTTDYQSDPIMQAANINRYWHAS